MRLTEGELHDALRDERPSIDAEFAAMLDERAAQGFPRERSSRWAELADRLRAVPPRRLLVPTGAVATLLVVAGVSVSTTTQSLSPSDRSPAAAQEAAPAGAASGGGAAGAELSLPKAAAPAVPAGQRKVASTADLTLSTDPDNVRDAASQVTDVVRRYRGLVISSQITSGRGGPPQPIPLEGSFPVSPSLGAEFQLRIPAAKLEPALDDLSGLGLVVSRTEGSQDITRRFNTARDSIAGLTSERDTLIAQLAKAASQEAIHAIKHRLGVVRRELARAQGRLGQLHERVAMVPVHMSIEARGGASGGGGGFGIDDALHDAGRVLTVAAGVLLISLAVLAPLALIGLLAWLATRAAIRIRRERALSDSV